MSCGLDIFEDSSSGLELERIKDKIRAIWGQVLIAQYKSEYGDEFDDSEEEDRMSKEEYMEKNALYFPGDDKPENEVDNIISMLDGMFDEKEELDSVKSDVKAPSYSGSQLKSNNEKGTVETTTYKSKHIMTSTPKDSQSSAKSSTYGIQSGKIAPRKDSKVKTSYAPMVQKIVEELLDIESRRNIGRRKQFFRL